MSEIATNKLIFDEILRMHHEESSEHKIVATEKKVLVTEEYGIFRLANDVEFKSSNGNTDSYELKMDTYKVNNDKELVAVLRKEAKRDDFYGAVVVIDSQPYNPLSFIYINREISINKETTLVMYYRKDKIDNKIVDEVYNKVKEIYIEDIEIESKETEYNEISMTAYAPRELEDMNLDIHLDSIHVQISNNISEQEKALLLMSRPMLLNTKINTMFDSSSNLIGDNWGIEHSVIYNGSVLPTYGFWKYVDGKMKKLITATDHPNVSREGDRYCTGINNHKSIRGIAELCYGNLNSPLNSNIYHENTFSVAKGYIRFFMEEIYGY